VRTTSLDRRLSLEKKKQRLPILFSFPLPLTHSLTHSHAGTHIIVLVLTVRTNLPPAPFPTLTSERVFRGTTCVLALEPLVFVTLHHRLLRICSTRQEESTRRDGERSDDDEQRQRPRRRFDVPVVRELGDDERRRRTKSPLNLQGWCRQWRQGRRRTERAHGGSTPIVVVSPTRRHTSKSTTFKAGERRAAQRHDSTLVTCDGTAKNQAGKVRDKNQPVVEADWDSEGYIYPRRGIPGVSLVQEGDPQSTPCSLGKGSCPPHQVGMRSHVRTDMVPGPVPRAPPLGVVDFTVW